MGEVKVKKIAQKQSLIHTFKPIYESKILKNGEIHRPPNIRYISLQNNSKYSGSATLKPPRTLEDDTLIPTSKKDIGNQINNSLHVETFVCQYEGITDFGVASFGLEPDIGIQFQGHRDWTAYNLSQTHELVLFDGLLRDLVKSIPETEQTTGRPRIPDSELVFYAIKKVHFQLSARRIRGMFGKDAPHFNMISRFLMRKETTPILHELIRLSSLPLAGIETDFAVDSTGFRTTIFNEYHKAKHKKKKQHQWLKAHICSGVRTNIVTAINVTDGYGNDSPQFEGLVRRTAEGFEISEVSADKGYPSRKNYNIVEEVGGQAYIPFKKNATARAGGSPAWKKAFHMFQLHREDFDAHYHKRSNVESTIGAIKAKVGEVLKSKDRIAQENELLCKILAYNISVLIRAMYELDIDLNINSVP